MSPRRKFKFEARDLMKQISLARRIRWHSMCAVHILILCLLSLGRDARADAATESLDPAAALDQACRLPGETIEIPDGATAPESEMLRAQTEVRNYDAAITAYTKCLSDTEAQLLAQHPESFNALSIARADRNNGAVARAEKTVASFNEALHIYRNRGFTRPLLKKKPTERELEICYPQPILRAEVKVVLSISETGVVTHVGGPPGVTPEVQAAIRCVIGKMVFGPATQDGKPVSSTSTLPIHFSLSEDAKTEPLKPPLLLSQPAEIAVAHDKCLPADLHEGGKVGLALKVSRTGRVVAVQTAVSSGSKKVDRVAACVARSLRYARPQYRGKEVDLDGVASVIVVTPRSQDSPVATE
jgi:hypothetical protein